MRYTRVYTGPDGETHFEDAETAGETTKALESDLVGTVSETFPVTGVYFREVHEESSPVPHNAPHPLFIVGLRGTFSVEVSDGETRVFPPGSVLLVEDTTGKGHTTRRVGDKPRATLMAPLREDAI
jgi:quercetin dioxygenase-like cupin family protein